jgi:hypothetical protein
VKRRKIAFVVQRCGREIAGGAEAHCLVMAQRMSAYWETEVLTTCALDYETWKDSYPSGPDEVDGTLIRRFPVAAPRDIETFNRISEHLPKLGEASVEEERKWMHAQGPWSPALVNYIEANADSYDVFIFFTYLYWHTWAGLPKVAKKAILVPLAHDEWTIYLNIFK